MNISQKQLEVVLKKRNRIKVLGQWVTLEHADLSKADTDGGELCGDCDVDKRIIRLDEKLEGEEYRRVLRHEVFHMKVRISGLKELLSDEVDEALAVLAEVD